MSENCRVTRDNSARIKAELQKRVNQAVAKAAADVEANAKTDAPIDTGWLRNSIGMLQRGEADWMVGVGASYGRYVEFGTYKVPARPFLMPAFEKTIPVLKKALIAIRARGMRRK